MNSTVKKLTKREMVEAYAPTLAAIVGADVGYVIRQELARTRPQIVRDHDNDMKTTCELCGEPIDFMSPLPSLSEAGEFWEPDEKRGVIAHADCGLSYGLELA